MLTGLNLREFLSEDFLVQSPIGLTAFGVDVEELKASPLHEVAAGAAAPRSSPAEQLAAEAR
jgi:hypothetical protein